MSGSLRCPEGVVVSTTEFTRALLIPILGSADWTGADITKALVPILGPPTVIDDVGEDPWFTYSVKVEGSHHLSRVGHWAPGRFNEAWALGFTLSHSRDQDEHWLAITLGAQTTLVEAGEALLTQAGLEAGEAFLVSYSWYNGSDEPSSIPLWTPDD